MEVSEFPPFGLDPLRAVGLDLFDQVSDCDDSRESKENVHVITRAIDRQRGRLQLSKDLRHVRMQFRFDVGRNERFSVLCAEDEMDENR